MKIPLPTDVISECIDASHERRQEPPRAHMGASLLGHRCDRYLWLQFRWAAPEKFPGRILRLFRRGQNEEATVIADLERIGCVLRPGDGQARVSFGSHVSGSLDGIIEYGVPGASQTPHVLEIKTHSKKSFDALEKDGVQKAKPMHYVQMQVYMHGTKLTRALYVGVCKDDDRLHCERVKYDESVALKAIERGRRIATTHRMPEPISADPSWYECKFCPAHDLCHVSKLTQEVNCRTCMFSSATPESTWICARNDDDEIPLDYQRAGCGDHALHPDLVPWDRCAGGDEDWRPWYRIDGVPVANGPGGTHSHALVRLRVLQ